MTCQLPVVLRIAQRDDLAFVVHSWIESLAMSNRWCPTCLFFERWHDLVEDLTNHNRVLLACFDEDPNYILGWACATNEEPATLLYSYVRGDKRKCGVARLLVEALGFVEPIRVSSWSRHSEIIAEKHDLVFRPYAVKELMDHDNSSPRLYRASDARERRARPYEQVDRRQARDEDLGALV